ncbi:uncharacterized protein DSM5745_08872 [Aspergillus mulundensis]|uniref:Uncharacterized protein n=1 Tax=Aspergillus mulundensis TaxID=1810919 RepID=A0A3D8R4X1_9EURO|nr:hypothetical protein DSM5745_08872 [Aspergillus mulundensis]RDW69112.1 hypothetical protein DSM5745_08872 [Aspergillus mulundensis]
MSQSTAATCTFTSVAQSLSAALRLISEQRTALAQAANHPALAIRTRQSKTQNQTQKKTDTPSTYEVIVATARPTKHENETPPNWTIFLHAPGTRHSRSYSLRRIQGGGMDWDSVLGMSWELVYDAAASDTLDDRAFGAFSYLGQMPGAYLEWFEGEFRALTRGPNNFFVARLFARMQGVGLTTGEVVMRLVGDARYSEREFRGLAERGKPDDGYLAVDEEVLRAYGRNSRADGAAAAGLRAEFQVPVFDSTRGLGELFERLRIEQ